MASKKTSFLDIDSKIFENNLTFEECKPAGLDEYKALLGIDDEKNSPWKLITPKPGFCIKTYDANKQKVFVNFCTLDELPEPKDINEDQLLELIESRDNTEYKVPLSLQEPRDQPDKAGNPATCYDVAINPNFLVKVEASQFFKMFLIQVTFDGLKDKFDVDLEIEDYVTLKSKCMGTLIPHRIRNVSSPYQPPKKLIEDVTNIKGPPAIDPEEKPSVNYRLVCVQKFGKDYLYGEVHLPDTILAKDILFEIGADRVCIESRRCKSVMDVHLPVKLDATTVLSEFSTATQILHFVTAITSL